MKTITSTIAYGVLTSATVCLAAPAHSQPSAREDGIDMEFNSREPAMARASDNADLAILALNTASTEDEPTNKPAAVSQVGDIGKRRPRTIEEVIVTAQKREQRDFDVPMSIVAMNAEVLDKKKIAAIDDLALTVPGLSIVRTTWSRQIMLRGISNQNGNSSLIGLYLDELTIGTGAYTQLDVRTYDLDRVEVLRGPQGTLYGEGSAGGTVRFITKDPQLDRFAANTDVTAFYTEDGAPGGRVEGMLNVPLIDNTLGFRLAGTFEDLGGWIDQPAAGRKDINDQRLGDVRLKALWKPSSQFTMSAMALVHRNDAPPNMGEDEDGNYTQVFNLTTTPDAEDNFELYNLTLTYDFPSVRLLSTTGYIEQDRTQGNEGRHQPLGFRIYYPEKGSELLSDIFTQEVRLTSRDSGPWEWTMGAFYRRAQTESGFSFVYGIPGPVGTPLPAPFSFEDNALSKSWAVFGDVSNKITDRLTLGVGLRYFEDEQEYITGSTTQADTFDALSPRIYTQLELTDNVNMYASAARGFRSGGFNALNQPAYGPEHVTSYDVGTKVLLLDGRLRADVAVYYSEYTDYQVFGLLQNPPLSITSNAGDARIRGIEWAFAWRPADQWTLSLNGNYVNSEFVEINATSTTHAVGDALDLFPEYAYTVSAERSFEWSGRPGFVRVDYNEQGPMTLTNRRNLRVGWPYVTESDVINMLNIHARTEWNDRLSVGLFAQNVLNDRGFTSPQGIFGISGRSRPRTFGIEFSATF